MNSPTTIRENSNIDINNEIMGFGLKVGAVLAALVGIWGLTCLVAGLVNAGAGGMLRGYITALTGL